MIYILAKFGNKKRPSQKAKSVDILKSHIIKGDFDDEAFNSGEEVVIFVDKNPDGEYDDTIVEGIDIKLNNYKCRLTAYNNTSNIDSLNSYERALSTYKE